MPRVERKIVDLNTRTANSIKKTIEALEGGVDPKSVLNKYELRALEAVGGVKEYLAILKETERTLQIPDLGE